METKWRSHSCYFLTSKKSLLIHIFLKSYKEELIKFICKVECCYFALLFSEIKRQQLYFITN